MSNAGEAGGTASPARQVNPMKDDIEEFPADPTEDLVIPLMEEELTTGTRAVKTGAVRVDKHVEKRVQRIEAPLLHEDVDIKRVVVNRQITAMPAVRRVGDTVIVPIVEEELVVTKQLILKEEIHLIKRRTKQHVGKDIEVSREHAEIHRLNSEGKPLNSVARERAPKR